MTITQEAQRVFSDPRRWRELIDGSEFMLDTRPGLYSMFESEVIPTTQVVSTAEAQSSVDQILSNLSEYRNEVINLNTDTSSIERLSPVINRLLNTLLNSRESIPIADFLEMEEVLTSVGPILLENITGLGSIGKIDSIVNTVRGLVESDGADLSLTTISTLVSDLLGDSPIFRNSRISTALELLSRFKSDGDFGSKLLSLVPELISGEIADLDLQTLEGLPIPEIPQLSQLSGLIGKVPQIIGNINVSTVQAYGEGLITTEAVPLQPVSTFNYGEAETPIQEEQLLNVPMHRFTQRISSLLDSGMDFAPSTLLPNLNSIPESALNQNILNEINGVVDILGVPPVIEVPGRRTSGREDYQVESRRLS